MAVAARAKQLAIQTYFDSPPTARVMVGIAVVTMVASTAEMKETQQREAMTSQKRQV
jgi:hypothetical protein